MALLEIKDLSFTYAVSNTPSIKNISLKINKGEFISICGPTGSGKSTLIKMLKKELTPVGKKNGAILLDDKNLDEIPEVDIAGKIGFVKQNPEQQIVTDKVWHEIAFGLENLGKKQDEIALRVAEISSYFGIEKWFTKNTFELSGGQKQLLNLASVMVMNPEVLILDEPTAQLDPIAASDFISTLKKINSDLSITIIIIEHRLEEILPISDRAILLDHGQVISDSTTEEMIKNTNIENSFFLSLPASSRLFKLLGSNGKCPLTIKDGRNFIESNYSNETKSLDSKINSSKEKKAIEIKDAFFKYEKRSDNVLNGLNITIHENEVMCLLGGNGSGKTTLINTIAGINKLYSGKIKIFDKNIESYKNQSLYNNCVSLLPQDVQTVFMKSTVREELKDVLDNKIALPFDLSHLYDKHPYDLSGGEQQLVAFAKVLATNPKILLMDEPTKGLDANHKNTLLKTIRSLKECGVTIIIVTHDVEFAADCADRCALLFRGEIVSINYPESFFSNNNFYTTSSVRMSKGYYNNVVTIEQLAKICEINGAKS